MTPEGNVAIHRYTFDASHDEDDLRNGVAVFTPQAFDVLLDAWIDVDEVPWDGTTPMADIASDAFFTAQGHGLFNHWQGAAVDLTMPRTDETSDIVHESSVPLGRALSTDVLSNRRVPALFLSDQPLKVVVSQDGTQGGVSPGSTTGAFSVHLVVATPIDVAFGHRVGN